jgi:hypothetical protein
MCNCHARLHDYAHGFLLHHGHIADPVLQQGLRHWLSESYDPTLCVPLTPCTLKLLQKSIGPLDPAAQQALFDKHGFKYCTITGMLIFALQIGRFDIAPGISSLCKFNDHPADAHYLAGKNIMRYLCTTL